MIYVEPSRTHAHSPFIFSTWQNDMTLSPKRAARKSPNLNSICMLCHEGKGGRRGGVARLKDAQPSGV